MDQSAPKQIVTASADTSKNPSKLKVTAWVQYFVGGDGITIERNVPEDFNPTILGLTVRRNETPGPMKGQFKSVSETFDIEHREGAFPYKQVRVTMPEGEEHYANIVDA